jgi:hypothetical protein
MHFRSLDCDSADEDAWKFDVPDGNARRFDAPFDCPNADALRSNDEFSLGPSTL